MRSSHRLIISPDAEEDLRAIIEYSLSEYGEAQEEAYAMRLNGAMALLTQFPLVGRSCEEIGDGLRRQTVGEHHLYYRIGARDVTIVRVLHEKMDAGRHVGQQKPRA